MSQHSSKHFAKSAPAMRDLDTEATRVHVESAGRGTPVVLLHGFAMHGGLFAPLLPSLARSHRVLVADLPGHGRSPPVEPFDLSSLVRAIDASIGGDAPMTVIGWSLGGQVALQWALMQPARVKRIVLVATTPSFVQRADWPHAMAVETLARFGDELRVAYRVTLQRFLALQVQGSGEGRATLAQLRRHLFDRGEPSSATLAAALELAGRVDLRLALPAVATPALVVAGDRDALVPLQATRELAAALPAASHVTIEGAAHAPFLSHPAAFLGAVRPFIDG
jgi:pimeloyl-[acyl-carrier protein] methyl ester esterase